MLPLFYVGWADSVLSPSEVRLINEKINSFTFLKAEDRVLLSSWADPANPPSSELFEEWVGLIRQASENLTNDGKQSLVDLGLEMAKQNCDHDEALHFHTAGTKEALDDLQESLGINSLEIHRNILSTKHQQFVLDEIINKPSFDVDAMTALLDDDYAEMRNRIRTLLADPVFRYPTLPDKDDFRMHVLEWCKMLAKQGLGSLAFSEAYGGKNDMGAYAALFETLGYHDLSLVIKFGVHFGLFGGSVQNLGTKIHHDKYLKDIGSLKLSGCFAMTETGHGSNVRGLETTATYDKATDEIIIHTPHEDAGKEYIGNALHSHMASVFAQLIVNGESHGVHAVLVPLRDENMNLLAGRRVEDCGYKLGLNGVDNGRIWFDNVRVPRTNLLNRFGNIDEQGNYSSPIENPSKRFFTMLGTLVGGRVCVPRAGLSAAKSGLTIAIKYALKRRQFGPNDQEPETLLLDYPSHQKRLMPLLAKSYALDFALTYLTKRYINMSEEDSREIETLAAGLKSYSTWFTTDSLQECREACGGKGYLAENRFTDLKADSDIFTTFEGDNTVLMQLVAKGLLTSFNKEFHSEGFMGVLKFVAGQVGDTITEFNPFFTKNTETTHLLDPEFQLEAFQYRERKQLAGIAQKMRDLIKKQLSSYDAFLRCQTQLLDLAHAFVERIVLEQFIEQVNNCEDASLKKVLKRLCDLYALHAIQEDKGWFLENDYMDGVKTKAIDHLVAKLCKDVRNDAGFLVDAFAIPEPCLNAPIIV